MAGLGGGDKLRAELNRRMANLATAKAVQAGFAQGSRFENGVSMATAAAANNYGAPSRGIPPRPFFSNAVAEGRKTWGQLLALELKRHDFHAARALEGMGAHMAQDIAAALVAITGPALSQVTLLLRDRFPDRVGMTFEDVMKARADVAAGVQSTLSGTGAKPLVWTGQTLQHLQGPQAYQVLT